MSPSRRLFAEKLLARIVPAAEVHRAAGTRGGTTIAGVLDRIIREERAILATPASDGTFEGGAIIAAPASITPGPVAADLGWRSAAFYADGRFDPFAGSKSDRMRASAATCDQIGEPAAAARYRAIADRLDAGETLNQVLGGDEPTAAVPARQIWTGPNLPPPEPTPFVAGAQLGFAL